jgi:hypothetical protein
LEEVTRVKDPKSYYAAIASISGKRKGEVFSFQKHNVVAKYGDPPKKLDGQLEILHDYLTEHFANKGLQMQMAVE